MSDRLKSILPLAIGAIALVVMVVGLASTGSSEPTAEDRVAALSDSIKCPFCNGESLADSASGVAADYRALIAVRVAEGATDEEGRLAIAVRREGRQRVDRQQRGEDQVSD